MREAGADLLRISRIPMIDFCEWWSRESERAVRDQVQLVVAKQLHENQGSRIKALQDIEEEEWYNDDEGPTRIRFTTYRKLINAIYHGEQLRDDWGEIIERGTGPREIPQRSYSLRRTKRRKRQIRITWYIQHQYFWRKNCQLRSDGKAVIPLSADHRPPRVTNQSRITCYFKRMNR